VFAASLADNLLTAPVIAFLVALVATLLKFEVRLPESLYPILSTFLLLAIGIKGGKALGGSSLHDIWKPLIAAVGIGVVTPVIAFLLFRWIGRLDTVNSSALAAHYGSVSAVTFTVVISVLDARGIEFEGFVSGLLAVLEIIGIVVALFLANDATNATASTSDQSNWRSALAEVVRGRSIALLVTGLVIGAVVGKDRLEPTDPLFVGLFAGVLTLFLIEMGRRRGGIARPTLHRRGRGDGHSRRKRVVHRRTGRGAHRTAQGQSRHLCDRVTGNHLPLQSHHRDPHLHRDGPTAHVRNR